MPKLEIKPSKSRGRVGDLLAVLLLLAVVAGLGWLWWQQKHGHSRQPPPSSVKFAKPNEEHQVVPSLVLVERKPDEPKPPPQPAPLTVIATNATAPPLTSNSPVVEVPVVAAKPVPWERQDVRSEFPRPARTMLEAQIALARRGISPGSIDGAIGSQTREALAVFQTLESLVPTRTLDTNTGILLHLDAPSLKDYIVTSNDLAHLQPLGKTWLAKSQQSALEYETILQLVSEKAHAHPALIQKLNPDTEWTAVTAGTVLKIPNVVYPEPADKASYVIIHLSGKYLEAFGTDSNLLAHFPCSIAAKVEKRPIGELHVAVIAPNPNYTFDPEIFSDSPEARAIGRKLILPPGPKNPVGVAWIGLDKPGYGMHGTPSPEQIGRTESHGCFRLANWDAQYLLKLVWIGMPVYVEP